MLAAGLVTGLVLGFTVAEIFGDTDVVALCAGDAIEGLVETVGLVVTTFDLHPQSIETNTNAGIITVAIFFIL